MLRWKPDADGSMLRRLAALAAALFVSGPGLASHMGQYATNPVEHDDRGRSDEPDSARTAVLGPALENKVLDLDLDGFATPDSALPPAPGLTGVLAPGCWGAQGRLPSGWCGANTLGLTDVLPPLGVPCLPQLCPAAQPPGAYTPTRSTRIRFLDVHLDLWGVGNTVYQPVDVNHKLADAEAVLGPASPDLGPVTLGPAHIWAWFGDWQDRNANGVIDHLGDSAGHVRPDNEFVWRGGCLTFASQQVNPGPHCELGPGNPRLLGYSFPGHHRGAIGVFPLQPVCVGSCVLLGDTPGAEPACWAAWLLLYCDDPGDAVFGPQGSVAPDARFDDRTGDPSIYARGWTYDQGWPAWYYDQSLLVRHVFAAAYDPPPDPASPNGFRLAEARFLDIDVYEAVHTATEPLLQGQVKPALRGAWLLLRDGAWPALERALDDVQRAADEASWAARVALGPYEDRLLDPGWSREPSTVLDQYPGARFRAFAPGPENPGEALHHGWLHDYSGYASGPHAWADLQSFREVLTNRFVGLSDSSGCILCVAGPGWVSRDSPEPMQGHAWPRAAGDHARSLGPGIHFFHATAGRWLDLPQPWPGHGERLAPDGWVGNVLNASVQPPLLGGASTDTCTIAGVTATYPWGWCHPYQDGAISDPQQPSPSSAEWSGDCGPQGGHVSVEIRPEGGAWSVPVLVWRDTWDVYVTEGIVLEDHTGQAGPVTLRLRCWWTSTGLLFPEDALVLPAGNAGLRVVASLALDIAVGDGLERVVDVDVYEPLGPPSGPS